MTLSGVGVLKKPPTRSVVVYSFLAIYPFWNGQKKHVKSEYRNPKSSPSPKEKTETISKSKCSKFKTRELWSLTFWFWSSASPPNTVKQNGPHKGKPGHPSVGLKRLLKVGEGFIRLRRIYPSLFVRPAVRLSNFYKPSFSVGPRS